MVENREVEKEVKVLNVDLSKMEKKIISLGGKLIDKERQINYIFDSEELRIQKEKEAYLRIREKKSLLDGNSSLTLTYKKSMGKEELRKNIEYNVALKEKDLGNIIYILKELGYSKIEEGYKLRTSYELEGYRLDLDVWDEKTYPYPYMEIEMKESQNLDYIIELLNLNRKDVTTESIADLKNKL